MLLCVNEELTIMGLRHNKLHVRGFGGGCEEEFVVGK